MRPRNHDQPVVLLLCIGAMYERPDFFSDTSEDPSRSQSTLGNVERFMLL